MPLSPEDAWTAPDQELITCECLVWFDEKEIRETETRNERPNKFVTQRRSGLQVCRHQPATLLVSFALSQSVTAPTLLLETSRAYFARTPRG